MKNSIIDISHNFILTLLEHHRYCREPPEQDCLICRALDVFRIYLEINYPDISIIVERSGEELEDLIEHLWNTRDLSSTH